MLQKSLVEPESTLEIIGSDQTAESKAIAVWIKVYPVKLIVRHPASFSFNTVCEICILAEQ